tara:strand:+ start:633 stop:1061 length:429 start_codon:yes stop_codon:yes gene_type:complete
MDSKAQAFAPFRMLIGAVMAMLILVIIIGAIDYFDGLEITVSRQRFYDGLNNAINQPNETILQVEDAKFSEGTTFSTLGLSKISGLESECLEFVDTDSPTFLVEDDLLTIREKVLTDVFIKCETENGSCVIFCELSFGADFS